MMKTIFLLLLSSVLLFDDLCGQTLKHFEIEDTGSSLTLTHKSDTTLLTGYNSYLGESIEYIVPIMKSAFVKLPENIKQEVMQQKVWLDLYLNPKGKIFRVRISIRDKSKFILNDKLWLKIYNIAMGMQFDMSKVKVADDFDWGTVMYPLNSKYLYSK